MTDVWEYMTKFIFADIENKGAKEYISKNYSNWSYIPKFTPVSLVPVLNSHGADGWELIHIEPVRMVGKNHDIFYHSGTTNNTQWSNAYFCAFKRKVSDKS